MREIETFQDSAQHYFEVAKQSEVLDDEIALEAFELLTGNDYDHMSAHALGVRL